MQKRAELLGFLEQAVVVLLAQATRYLIDPAVPSHDKLQLKKELANELVNASCDQSCDLIKMTFLCCCRVISLLSCIATSHGKGLPHLFEAS